VDAGENTGHWREGRGGGMRKKVPFFSQRERRREGIGEESPSPPEKGIR